MLAIVVLSSALVSGGWLVQRGLVGGGGTRSADRARLFDEVYRHVSREYVDTLSDSILYTRAAEGLVQELGDPHSSYLSPAVLARLSERTSGKYVGVGVQIDVRDGWITVVTPLPGGPAIEAGIQAGDRITEMDGKPIHAQALDEAQKALRGAPGSVMRLTIERPGVSAPLKFALTRREIRTQSVQHGALLRDGVGYVALTIFSEASAPELQRTIDSLRAAGMKSLIFDLRGDPGGLLGQGVAIADLFLDPGQRIVSLRGRTPDASHAYTDRAGQPWPQMPVALLVDSNSASAAEIVAGALQDHDRALLVGTTTYGKGSAQNVFPLPNGGAVKLTTARWYTPSGRSINRPRPSDDGGGMPKSDSAARPRFTTDGGRTVLGGGGITPDILLPADSAPRGELAFQRALGKQIPQFRSALTEYALSLKNAHAVTSPNFAVTPAMRAELRRRMLVRGIAVDSGTMDAARSLIDRQLGYEIARDVFGTPAEYARRLRDDPAVTRTVSILAGAATQADLLKRATASSGPRS
ncbi:MAG: carboxyl-terminal protease [Gemmatimonadetes bacterium]|nr:carboxyl-terminal protease [Gemmatimonadota bacterium]